MSLSENTPRSNQQAANLIDMHGESHEIAAKRLDLPINLKLGGTESDISGASVLTDFDHSAPDIVIPGTINSGAVTSDKIHDAAVVSSKIATSAVIAEKISTGAVVTEKLANESVTEAKIAPSAVTTTKIHDGAVTLAKISSSAIDTQVATSSSNLITSGAVRTAIDNAMMQLGEPYGPKTVDEINALGDAITNGSTVHATTAGSIQHGISIDESTGQATYDTAIPVRAGEDFRFFKSGNNLGWYSLDSEFKIRQQEKPSPNPDGNALAFIDSISQNANGDITATKKNIYSASTTQVGVVKLNDAIDSSVTNEAATANAVKRAYDHATDLVNSLDYAEQGADGSYIKKIKQENGLISVTVESMDTVPTTNSTNAVTSGGVKTAIDAVQNDLNTHHHGNISRDGKIGNLANQAVVTGEGGVVQAVSLVTADVSASGNTLEVIESVTQDSRGKITPVKKNIQEASTSQKGVVQLSNDIDSDSETTAATSKALKDAMSSTTMQELDLNGDETICTIKQENGVVVATKQPIQLTATFDDTTRTLIFNNISFSTGIWPIHGNFGLGVWSRSETPENDSAEASSFHGDREWLLDWRPYLIDMSPVPGQVKKKPVAELMKNNWLRDISGNYAPVVGITAEQSTACNKTVAATPVLYWKYNNGTASNPIADSFYEGTTFLPVAFWEYCKEHLTGSDASSIAVLSGVTYNSPIEVKLYKADGTELSFGNYTSNHIVAPWETTETKYSIFIGRPDDIYVFDGVTGDTQGEIHGITSKPVKVDGRSATDFKLVRTGIGPCPYTTKNDKARVFFYNYVGTDSNTSGNGELCNDGTYPRTADVNAFSTHARACNADPTKSYPVAEGGWFALNAFLTSVEVGYGTKALHAVTISKSGNDYTMFTSGVSGNDPESEINGGLRFHKSKTVGGQNFPATWYQLSNGAVGANVLTADYPFFKCLEPQIAASLIVEMGLSYDESKSFKWNGGTWTFRTPTGLPGYEITGLGYGEMNVILIKQMTVIGRARVNSSLEVVDDEATLALRAGLVQGFNLCGDIYANYAGGSELIYTQNGSAFKADYYVCPDQTKWVPLSNNVELSNLDEKFPAEESPYYIHTVSNAAVPNTWGSVAERYPNSPYIKSSGGTMTTAEAHRSFENPRTITSYNYRLRMCQDFRCMAGYAYCAPRTMKSSQSASTTENGIGGSVQCLLS